MSIFRFVFSILTVLVLSQQLWAATFNLGGSVDERRSFGSEPTYDLSFQLVRWPFVADTGHDFEIVDPLGSRHQGFVDSTIKALVDIQDLSATDLGDYAGDWNIEETLPDGQINVYQLTMPDLSAQPYFQGDPPVITAPNNFATLDPQFEVEWTNSTDCSFNSFSLPESIDCHSPGAATFAYTKEDGVFDRPFSLAVYSSETIPDFFEIEPATIGSTTIESGTVSLLRHSESIAITVVPEPNGILTTWIGLLVTLSLIRKLTLAKVPIASGTRCEVRADLGDAVTLQCDDETLTQISCDYCGAC